MMKKILSLLIATAMMLTAFAGIASAADITTENKATLRVTFDEVEIEDIEGDIAYDVEDLIDVDMAGKEVSVHEIKFYGGNLPSLTGNSGARHTGEGVTALTATFDIDTTASFDATPANSDFNFVLPSGADVSKSTQYATKFLFNYNPNNSKTLLVDGPVTAGSEIVLATIYLVVDKSYAFDIDFTSGTLAIATYSNARAGQGTGPYDVQTDMGNLTVTTNDYQITTSGGGGGGDPETYIVAFVDWDDTPIASGDDYEEGDSVTAPADPTRPGWTFIGWTDENSNTYAGNAIPAVGNDNATYTATYSQNHYTITFKDYDDTPISSDSTYVYGDTVTPPADPTRPDYTFAGWDPAVATVTADAIYIATYTKDPVYAESITITGDSLTNVSTTVQLDYEVDPSEAVDTVAWEIVSGPATINDSGLVTPTGVGVVEVQITASPSGATDTHTIKVVANAVAPTVEAVAAENPYLNAPELVDKKYDDGNYYHLSDATISSADTTNYIYKAWAREYGSEEKHYFELPEDIDAVNEFLNVESSGAALNFILMIKSATHKIVAAGIDAFLDK